MNNPNPCTGILPVKNTLLLRRSLPLFVVCVFAWMGAFAQALQVSECPIVVKRSNGNGQAGSAAGDFRPQSAQNNPVAPNVTGTKYQLVPLLPSLKTGDVRFKWSSNTAITNIPVITRAWLTASGSSSGTLNNVKFGPPGPVEASGNTYYVNYCFYNNNLPNQGRLTLEFTDPQTHLPVFMCTYDLGNNGNTSQPIIDCSPTVVTHPVGTVVCGNTPAKFFVEASGAAGYQWQVSNDNVSFTNISNGAGYSGATTDTLTISNATVHNGKYYRVVLSAAGCSSTNSQAARLVANSAPTAAFAGSNTLCGTGNRSLAIHLTGTAPWSITYHNGGAPITVNNIASSPYYISVSPSATTTYTITSVTDAYCTNSALAGNASVTILSPPTIVPSNAAACVGAASFTLPFTTTGGASTYSLVAGTRAMNGFVPVSNASLTASPLAVNIPASGVPAGVYDFKMVVRTAGGCSSDTAAFTVTINRLPSLSASASSSLVCSGAAVTLSAAPTNLSSYSWTANPTASIASTATPTVNPTANTLYTVVGTDANGCQASATVNVNIATGPAMSVTPSAPTICSGNSVSLTASGGSTYSWSPATGLSATSGATVIATPPTTTTYTVTSSNPGGCASVGTVTVTVTSPALAINNSSPNVCSGGIATLTATAGFTTYVWAPVTGLFTDAAATVAYTGTSVATVYAKPTASASYTVVATNASSCSSSATTTVTVAPSPVNIASANTTRNNYTFCTQAANSFALSVDLNATGLTTAWSYATTEGGAYTPASTQPAGATLTPSSSAQNATLTISNFNNGGYAGPRFFRLAISGNGCTTNYDITLYDIKGSGASLPAPIASQTSVCSGSGTNLSFGTVNSNLTIQWQSSTNNSTFVNVTGATSANYTTPSLTTTTYYRAIFSGPGSCNYTSGSVMITVASAPSGNTLTPSATCTNGSTFITINGTAVAGVSYQWQRSTTSASDGFTDLTGATGQNYTLNRNLLPVTTWYRRNAFNSTCFTNNSTAVAIFAPVTNNAISAGTAVFCGSSPATALTGSTPAGGDGTYTYQWQQSTDNSNWVNATGSSTGISYTTPVLTTTTYYRRVVSSGSCASSASASFVVTINPNPTVTISASATTVCGGSVVTLTASGANSYTWSPSTFLSATTGAVVLMTAPNATGSTSYTVTGTNSATGCSAASAATIINYSALPGTPTVSTSAATICSGGSYNLNSIITSGGNNDWFTAPTANALYQVASPTNLSAAGTYYVFARSGSCYSASFASFTLAVSNVLAPVPNATSISLCAPATANLVALQPAAAAGTELEWHTGNTFASPVVSLPTAAGSGTYYLFTKSIAGNCNGPASAAVVVNIHALPAATLNSAAVATCAPGTINLNSYYTPQEGTSYQWYSVANNPAPATLINDATAVAASGNYYLYATSAVGCKGNASPALAVTINARPAANIAAPATVCAASTLNIVGSSDVGVANFSWQLSTDGGLSFGNIANAGIYSGAHTATLSLANTTGVDGYQYRFTATNSAGCTQTSPAVVAGVEGIVSISAQPSHFAVTAGGSALFKVTTTGAPAVNYQWKVSTNGGGSYSNLAYGAVYQGVNTPDLIITSADAGFNGYRYVCEVSNNCTAPLQSSAGILSVNNCITPSVGGAIVGAIVTCAGSNTTTLNLAGSVGSVLRWEASQNNFATDPVIINNVSNTLTVTNLTVTTAYRAIVQSGACAVAVSAPATITVVPAGGWIGGTSGDWSNPANWCGGVPTSPSLVNIPTGSAVNITSGTAYATNVTIAPGASLVMSGSAILEVSAGGQFINSGTYNATGLTTGKLVFKGNGTIVGTTTFVNVDTHGALDFGTASTIAGTFTILPGGSVTGGSPWYACPGATLVYSTGNTFTRGLEWTSASIGAGYPSNVHVRNGTVLNFPVAGDGYICNDLLIDADSKLNQSYGGGSAALTVARDVLVSGTLTLGSMEGGNINIGRNWTRTAQGIFVHNNRTVTFNGTQAAQIQAPTSTEKNVHGAFGGETFYALQLNKDNAANTLALNTHIAVLKELKLQRGMLSLNNSDVVLVSKDEETAAVAPVPSTGVQVQYPGSGRFVVQRHLAIGASSTARRWRLLTVPVQATDAPTIHQAWQEGVSNADRNNPVDPWPGYGTTITKSTTFNVADGYDQGSTNNASMFAGVNSNGAFTWTVLPSTKVPVTNHEAYMLFARGNRSIVVSTPNINANHTVLQPRGRIHMGDIQKTIAPGTQVFGNPYASAIDFGKITFANYRSNGTVFNTTANAAAGVGITYYLWDPKTSGASNVGKWITCSSNGDGTFSITDNESGLPGNGIIQSGAAFMLRADTAGGLTGTLTFHEADKVAGSSAAGMASRQHNGLLQLSSITANLMVGSGNTAILSEGVKVLYNDMYRNQVDGQDAPAPASFNTTDGLAILSSGRRLTIERRNTIAPNDTIVLNLLNVSKKAYVLQIRTGNIDPTVSAMLHDNFLGTLRNLPLADTARIAFEVTADAKSAEADRFKIILRRNAPLAATFTNIEATQAANNIMVKWHVASEAGVENYQVEKSADGRQYAVVHTAMPTGSKVYSWLDADKLAGNNYYRIKSTGTNGLVSYSAVAKVWVNTAASSVQVLPNPAPGHAFKVGFQHMQAGKYDITVLNHLGQVVHQGKVQLHSGANTVEVKPAHNIANGYYLLKVSNNNGYQQSTALTIQNP